MSTTLRSENLVKIYKKRTVVNKTSVQVSKGEIVGLLGPNGAGKDISPNSTIIFEVELLEFIKEDKK